MSTSGTEGLSGAYDAPDNRTMEIKATVNSCFIPQIKLILDFNVSSGQVQIIGGDLQVAGKGAMCLLHALLIAPLF